jgi:hypothetical protein
MDAFTTSALGASRLRRIAGMSVAEIGCRGRQAGSKLIDRMRVAAPPDPHTTLQRHAPQLADPRAAVEGLRNTFDRCFFKGVTPEVIATIREQHREHAAGIVAQADALLKGRFDLLGYRDLDFGNPIDWHLDPVFARQSPLLHWSRIDALDPSVVGDSKIVWELNRHQWMVALAQASALTGDDRYARHAVRLLLDWIDRNPVGRGINWSSSLEVALRLISWTWVLALLRHTSLLDAIAPDILASIHAHATHVQRYLSHYYSPNTHLTGEALGLFYAGTLYPQFDAASQWRDTGATTLIEQAQRQITADGVYFEQSACYQRYTCDFYLHFLLLARLSGYDVPSTVRERLERAVDFLAAMTLDDGSMPSIGDADGGWLMPLARRSGDDARGTLAVAATVFDRADWTADGIDQPETLWLTDCAAKRPQAIDPAPQSQLFREGGYAILRSGPHQVIVDVGPLGCFGHAHADLLSIQCSIFGERCLVDAGTCGYTAEPEWRDYFRGTAAHNTVTIDGASQAIPAGPFGWQQRPAVTINEWQANDGIDIVDAQHSAYAGVTHRRRVMLIKPGVFIVIDNLIGQGRRSFELTFQFAPMEVALISSTTARATTPNGRSLWIMPFASTPLKAEIVTGRVNPIRGWVSADYGQRTPAPALVYSAQTQLPATIVTVLQPQSSSNQPCVALPEF